MKRRAVRFLGVLVGVAGAATAPRSSGAAPAPPSHYSGRLVDASIQWKPGLVWFVTVSDLNNSALYYEMRTGVAPIPFTSSEWSCSHDKLTTRANYAKNYPDGARMIVDQDVVLKCIHGDEELSARVSCSDLPYSSDGVFLTLVDHRNDRQRHEVRVGIDCRFTPPAGP